MHAGHSSVDRILFECVVIQATMFLMDSQGIFDGEATADEDNFIFGLSAYVSSVLVYNIDEMIHNNDIEHLKIFVDNAKTGFSADKDSSLQVKNKRINLNSDITSLFLGSYTIGSKFSLW